MTCYLGLGSNLGNRKEYIDSALSKLNSSIFITLHETSNYIETKPIGNTDQPDFINCITRIETDLTPMNLLKEIGKIEEELGRTREVHWGPRTIDIDILFCDDLVIDLPDLTVPHPELHKREFILTSMLELAPDLMHPVLNKTIKELYLSMKNQIGTIILAAGKGTRMKAEKPKVVFELAGTPMINRVVKTAGETAGDRIAVVVGYKKEDVIESLKDLSDLIYVEQKEQNGTGHAVMVCKEEFADFNGTIFILCGDVPLLRYQTLQKMLDEHLKQAASCTVLTALMDDPAMYGRIVRTSDGKVSKITEFKDADESVKKINEINTGIYCFNAADLFSSLDKIDNNNNQKEFYLTDTLEILNSLGKKVESVLLDDLIEAAGVNSREQLQELENQYYQRPDHFDK